MPRLSILTGGLAVSTVAAALMTTAAFGQTCGALANLTLQVARAGHPKPSAIQPGHFA